MFSDIMKADLEKEIVGQTIAINTIVRGVTRLVSGLTPRERSLSAYMFIGPPSTGKSHVIRTLAGRLHGDEGRLVRVDCAQLPGGDPRMTFAAQLAPLFPLAPAGNAWPPAQGMLAEAPPLAVVHVELLERAPSEAYKVLASILETGQLVLPDGRKGSLRNCMFFVTSRLCCRQILDEAPYIGFSGALDEDDIDYEDRLYKLCYEEAQQHFGSDLVERLDRVVIFHRLQEEHLSDILDRRTGRLNQWLAGRRLQCELLPAAQEFLLARGKRDLHVGARGLLRAHQKFVEFPIADLLVSGRMPTGGSIRIDRRPEQEHLHFTVVEPSRDRADRSPLVREIPVG